MPPEPSTSSRWKSSLQQDVQIRGLQLGDKQLDCAQKSRLIQSAGYLLQLRGTPQGLDHVRGTMLHINDIVCNDLQHQLLQGPICGMTLQALDLHGSKLGQPVLQSRPRVQAAGQVLAANGNPDNSISRLSALPAACTV